MKNILAKSNENESSFQILKRKKKYNSCVHCAYYAAFQMSLYSLCTRFRLPFELLCEGKEGASHVKTIEELRKTIKRYNVNDANKYSSNMSSLMRMRIVADYKKDNITADDLDGIEIELNNVLKLLKDSYVC